MPYLYIHNIPSSFRLFRRFLAHVQANALRSDLLAICITPAPIGIESRGSASCGYATPVRLAPGTWRSFCLCICPYYYHYCKHYYYTSYTCYYTSDTYYYTYYY